MCCANHVLVTLIGKAFIREIEIRMELDSLGAVPLSRKGNDLTCFPELCEGDVFLEQSPNVGEIRTRLNVDNKCLSHLSSPQLGAYGYIPYSRQCRQACQPYCL